MHSALIRQVLQMCLYDLLLAQLHSECAAFMTVRGNVILKA